MSQQSFGEALGKLAQAHGLDNVVCTAVDSDSGEGCTLIKGNNSKLLTMLAVSTLKDITEKFGFEDLEEIVSAGQQVGRKLTAPSMEDMFQNASRQQKEELKGVLNDIKKALGLN